MIIILICISFIMITTSTINISANDDKKNIYSNNYYLVLNESDMDLSLYNQDYINDLVNEVFDALSNNINTQINYNYSLSQDLAE